MTGLARFKCITNTKRVLGSIHWAVGPGGAMVMWLKTIGRGRGGHSCEPTPIRHVINSLTAKSVLAGEKLVDTYSISM